MPQNAFQHTSRDAADPVRRQLHDAVRAPELVPVDRVGRAPVQVRLHLHPVRRARVHRGRAGRRGGEQLEPCVVQPADANLYVCSRDTQSAYKAIPVASGTYSGGRSFVGVSLSVPFVREITPGAFTAVDMRTNRIVWQRRFTKTTHGQLDASCTSGSLATAGGLVFLGLPQGYYHGLAAYDASTGKRLWRWNTRGRHRGAAGELQRRREAVRRGLRRRPRRARTARRQGRRGLRVYARRQLARGS